MKRIVEVQGFKAFHGTMRIHWRNIEPEEIFGDWLYRPDTNCWYTGAREYPAEICTIIG